MDRSRLSHPYAAHFFGLGTLEEEVSDSQIGDRGKQRFQQGARNLEVERATEWEIRYAVL